MADRPDPLVEDLRTLGGALTVPPPPDDLPALVLARIEAATPPRATLPRRAAAVVGGLSRGRRAVAVVVVAILVALGAAAPATATITHWLGIGGVVVVPAQGDPVAGSPPAVVDGTAVPLADARARVSFPLVVPAALGDPDQVRVSPDTDVVTMQWLAGGVRLDQFGGRPDPMFVKRYYGDAQYVTVAGADAVWLARPHPLEYIDPTGRPRVESERTSGPSLLWQRGAVTLRLEGVPTAEQAVVIADSVR
jgi:hypothetical protein